MLRGPDVAEKDMATKAVRETMDREAKTRRRLRTSERDRPREAERETRPGETRREMTAGEAKSLRRPRRAERDRKAGEAKRPIMPGRTKREKTARVAKTDLAAREAEMLEATKAEGHNATTSMTSGDDVAMWCEVGKPKTCHWAYSSSELEPQKKQRERDGKTG